MGTRAKTAILISGRGSNMQALVEASKAADYPAEISLVISNRADAAGLNFAEQEGITTAVVDHTAFNSREEFDGELDRVLRSHAIELVACAGFMRVLSSRFADAWAGRILNIHPSLLPAYKGLHTHERALEDGAQEHGCTVHFVVSELDAGPIIAQVRGAVHDGDTPTTLAARVLDQEHKLYPKVLAAVARGSVRLEDGRSVGEI